MFDRRIANWIIEKLNQYEMRQEVYPDKIFHYNWWKSSIIYQIFVPSQIIMTESEIFRELLNDSSYIVFKCRYDFIKSDFRFTDA